MFDYIVIGKGLIGAAAARHLAEQGASVAVIGPDEPSGLWASHTGVFGSYYDQGRISRRLDSDPIWATLADRSIDAYADLQHRSGLTFHYPTCSLMAGPMSSDVDSYINQTAQVAATSQHIDYAQYDESTIRNVYPFLHFAANTHVIVEQAPAGYVNPRTLVQAQLVVGQQHGLTVIRDEVTAVIERSVQTRDGNRYDANRILIATGGYVNSLLKKHLVLRPRARTILLAELSEIEATRLRTMPTLIVDGVDGAIFKDVYILPPIRYPDGKSYIKLGGDDVTPTIVDSGESLNAWFRGGGSPAQGETLKQCLLSLIPDLRAVAYDIKPCVTTAGAHPYPYLAQIDDGLYVAAAGWGNSAKSSNEIGRLAALVARGAWNDAKLEQTYFKAVFR